MNMKRTALKKKLTKGKVCKNCKNKFDQIRFGQVVCGYKCAVTQGLKLISKEEKATAKAQRRYIKAEKEKIKTLSQLKNDLQVIVNHIARLIDNGYGCISCGGNGKMSGGHYWAVGGHDQLRFNLHNIWSQDFVCNNHKGGAPREYIQAIQTIWGDACTEYLKNGMRVKYKNLRFNRQMIQDAIIIARQERNRLKKLDKQYFQGFRWAVRTEINDKIGIYL